MTESQQNLATSCGIAVASRFIFNDIYFLKYCLPQRTRKILFRDIAAAFTVAAMSLNNVLDDLVIFFAPLNAALHSHPAMIVLDSDNSKVKTVGNSSGKPIKTTS